MYLTSYQHINKQTHGCDRGWGESRRELWLVDVTDASEVTSSASSIRGWNNKTYETVRKWNMYASSDNTAALS